MRSRSIYSFIESYFIIFKLISCSIFYFFILFILIITSINDLFIFIFIFIFLTGGGAYETVLVILQDLAATELEEAFDHIDVVVKKADTTKVIIDGI